jgi:hypothetical protein
LSTTLIKNDVLCKKNKKKYGGFGSDDFSNFCIDEKTVCAIRQLLSVAVSFA